MESTTELTDGLRAIAPALRGRRYKYATGKIQTIVDAWPPLTDEQREKLALILCPSGVQPRAEPGNE